MRLFLGLIVLAACSPVVAHTPDGSTIDSTPDAVTHGMVTVKVYDINNEGSVVVGAPVVFVEADGTQVAHPLTAADGTVTADIHPGASVTAVIASGTDTSIMTLLDLKPGDNVILGPSSMPSIDLGAFTVNLVSYSGATTYDVYGPCGRVTTSATQASLEMFSNCKLDSMDITVVPRDSSGNPVAFMTKTGIAFTANGSVTLSGSYTIGLPAFTATLSNLDPVITNAEIRREMPDNYGYVTVASGTPSNGMLSLMAPGPIGTRATIETFINGSGGSEQDILQGVAGNAQTYDFDGRTTLLPWVNPPVLDIANHKITITTSTTGTTSDTPDVAFSQMSYQRTINGTINYYSWLLVGPTPTDVVLPMIPVDAGDVMPKTTDTGLFVLSAAIEADGVNGFDDLRLDIFKNLNEITGSAHPMTMNRVRESLVSSNP